MENRDAARFVFGIASLLESQGANPYRVRAYRRAALGLLNLPTPAVEYVNGDGELALPWLGPRLRRKLGELVLLGRMQFQDELLAQLPGPFRELLAVPGVGPKTAERLIRELGIHGVLELAIAAREQRLQTLRGIGPRRERQFGQGAEALVAQAA
ncbi:MAG: histidinol-phosphatase [Chloroflexi bacterium]|nr:histidinol-phosphatase [Chloroflexota bacterium]